MHKTMAGKRILIVDDDEQLCDAMRIIAEGEGWTVETADDFDSFRGSYRRFRPGFILLDLAMPDCDGIDLIRYLGEQKATAPVLIISGQEQVVLKSAWHFGQASGLRMVGYLNKPFPQTQLVAALNGYAPVFPADLGAPAERPLA